MRNKVRRSSHKILKHEKIQVSRCLIDVLRPQVYITDSSSFKRLVQELTGNGSTELDRMISPPLSGISTYDHDHQQTINVGIDQPAEPENYCFELGGSVDNHTIAAGGSTSINVNHHQGDNNKLLIAYRNLESWLLDSEDTCSFYDIVGDRPSLII